MVPVGCNIGSRFNSNLPNTHLQFLKLHWNVTNYISLCLSRNGCNAYFSFCVAPFSKNCITVVNYRICTSAPWTLKNVRLGKDCCRGWQHLTPTRMKSLNITSLQQKRYTFTKTIYTKDDGWVYFVIQLDTMNSRTETWNSIQECT